VDNIKKIYTLEEAKKEFNYEKIVYVKAARHSGVWYSRDIGNYFLVIYDQYHVEYKAMTCLTKYIKTSSWTNELSGWFHDTDIDVYSIGEYEKLENRNKKISEVLGV
jgi:hypothetical protein